MIINLISKSIPRLGQPLDLFLCELCGKFINVKLNSIVITYFSRQPLDLGLEAGVLITLGSQQAGGWIGHKRLNLGLEAGVVIVPDPRAKRDGNHLGRDFFGIVGRLDNDSQDCVSLWLAH